jgi:transposase
MEAYSLDLRKRVVAACDEGVLTRSEIAETFGVSVSFVTKLLRRRRDNGSIAAKPHTGGFAPALQGRALRALAALVEEQPDATLAELRDRLGRRCRVRVGVWTICRALAGLRLPIKKSRCTPASVTRPGYEACVAPSAAS